MKKELIILNINVLTYLVNPAVLICMLLVRLHNPLARRVLSAKVIRDTPQARRRVLPEAFQDLLLMLILGRSVPASVRVSRLYAARIYDALVDASEGLRIVAHIPPLPSVPPYRLCRKR